MKLNYLLLSFVAFIVAVSSSCQKDDTKGTISDTHVMQVYGERFSMTEAAIWKSGINMLIPKVAHTFTDTYQDAGGNNVEDVIEGFKAGSERADNSVFLFSVYEEGFYIDRQLNMAVGSGAAICFHLASPDSKAPKVGKYTFSTGKEDMTFVAYSAVNYTPGTYDELNGKVASVSEGELELSNDNGVYTIKFSGKTTIGSKIEVNYTGKPEVLNLDKNVFGYMEDVELAGLLRTVKIIEIQGSGDDEKSETSYIYDIDTGLSYVNIVAREVLGTKSASKENTAIAAVCNENKDVITLESPIVMRSYVDHKSIYNFTAHTTYMYAPSTFTDADFENINDESFSFDMVPETVAFAVNNFTPKYVYFEAGAGKADAYAIRGIIKVSDIKALGTTRINVAEPPLVHYKIKEVNPTLSIEIKYPTKYNNSFIR